VGGGKIHQIDVGGSFESKDRLEFGNIDVGGVVRLTGGSRGDDVRVGGSFKVEGDLMFKSIYVGGKVEITGTGEGYEVEVGGKVRVGRMLKLTGDLDVGGKADVSGDIYARNIKIGGILLSKKVTVEEGVEVGGRIETLEGVTGHLIEIRRRGEVRGSLRGDHIIIGRQATAEDIYGKTIELKRGAYARNVYGEIIIIESDCHINGKIQYTNQLKANEHISFAKPPQKVEKLPS
jgi:cytoskeletal protein CcmA (bactofilin family)